MADTLTHTKEKFNSKKLYAREKLKKCASKVPTKTTKRKSKKHPNQEKNVLTYLSDTANLPPSSTPSLRAPNIWTSSVVVSRDTTPLPRGTSPAASVDTPAATIGYSTLGTINSDTSLPSKSCGSVTKTNIPSASDFLNSPPVSPNPASQFPGTLPEFPSLTPRNKAAVFPRGNTVSRSCSDLMRSMAAEYNNDNLIK